MKFLLDSNMPRAAAPVVHSRAYVAEDIRDIGLGSATDAQVDEHAQGIGAVLVKRDLDFADVRRYPPEQIVSASFPWYPRRGEAAITRRDAPSGGRTAGVPRAIIDGTLRSQTGTHPDEDAR